MFNAAKWFAGFTVIQLLKNQMINVYSDEENCTVTKTDDNQLYADCSERRLTSIPRGLGKDLQILNISLNLLSILKSSDLQEYSSLRELIMRDLHVIYSIDSNFLMPLTELDTLDVSRSKLGALKFPSKIKILVANELHLISGSIYENYDFTTLEKLIEIQLNRNKLDHPPALYMDAPLLYMYLYENELVVLELDYLAHFCQLQNLGLSDFHPNSVDNCCYVKLWTDEYKITTELSCEKDCERSKYPFNQSTIEIYNTCLQKVAANATFWDKYSLILNFAVFGILIITIAFLALKYYRSSAVKEHKKRKKLSRIDTDEPVEAIEEASMTEEETIHDE